MFNWGSTAVTGIDRRSFSLLLGGLFFAPGLPAQPNPTPPGGAAQWLLATAASDSRKQHWLIISDAEGQLRLRHALPARAHHVTPHPAHPWVAVVARRPGMYIDVVDYRRQALVKRIVPGPRRHFYGHALFSADGRWLIASENALPAGAGRITVRDVQADFRTVADFSSGGIGPHEMLLSHDGGEVIVANGGIRTDPAQGRSKLNLDDMLPSLAYMHLESGQISEQQFLPPAQHQLSIRHLDINPDGVVVIAMQYQGAATDDQPLVAMHRRGEALQLLRPPQAISRQMAQYCGSVRIDASGQIAAVSAPRGDLITFWDIGQSRYLTSLVVRDGCGLSATSAAGEFIASSGRGPCYRLLPREGLREPLLQDARLDRFTWDNHLCAFQMI